MGYCTDWYAHIAASKYLGVAPWELIEQPYVWKEWALAALEEEAEAQKSIDEFNRIKAAR